MRVGVPKESSAGETRVAATPTTIAKIQRLGFDVTVEADAGALASFDDHSYLAADATIGTAEETWSADVVLTINPPAPEDLALMADDAVLVTQLAPAIHPERIDTVAAYRITVLSVDAVPRISRAQSLDVLSSMANIAGYRAVVEAAHEFGSFFTGQVTAAGKVPPAKVLVIGAGVAGLAAIGTARSLGAIVRATDTRPEVAEQVESMGADFLTVRVDEPESDGSAAAPSTGYAKESSEAYAEAAARLYAEQCADVDIVVTTALIPGRPAPRLLTEEMVASMRPGSVVVDMAAANGGNVAGTVTGEKVVTSNGVTILGYTDLPGRLPTQASQLYGTNMVNLLTLLCPDKDGTVTVDLDDPVVRGMCVTHDGEVMWPPPPVAVSAVPAVKPNATVAQPTKPARRPLPPWARPVALGLVAVLFLLLAANAPTAFVGHVTVFALACVVGFYVIWNVTHALHTPLMSVTNAISGIIITGALLQISSGSVVVTVLACVGVAIATVNIVGGFAVTRRMLSMFRRGDR